MIHQTKTIQIIVLTIDNLLADLLLYQTFFYQMLKKSQSTKLSHYTVYSYYDVTVSSYKLATAY